MEAICSSETSVDTQWATRRYIPEADTLQMLIILILLWFLLLFRHMFGF
jgi:hypothetical protein